MSVAWLILLQTEAFCQDEDMHPAQSEDECEGTDDEEDRASKRSRLTESVEAVGVQIRELQVEQSIATDTLSLRPRGGWLASTVHDNVTDSAFWGLIRTQALADPRMHCQLHYHAQ